MGIDLGDVVVRHPRRIEDYAGAKLAVDAWNILYQFVASIRGPDGAPLTDRNGQITSHLQGLLSRTATLLEAGIEPVFVFDGQPHPLKRETLAGRAERKERAQAAYEEALAAGDLAEARVKAQQTSRLSVPMVDEAKELLRGLGLAVVDAPGEGEAQASAMAQAGQVAAVVSQDYDAVLFGAPRIVRNLGVSGRRKVPGKQVWQDAPPEEIGLQESLDHMGVTREQLIEAAVLVGTDFHPGVKGLGAKTALGLVKKHGTVAAIQQASAQGRDQSVAARRAREAGDALADQDEVRRIFLAPNVRSVDSGDLVRRDLRREAIMDLLVVRHHFDAARVAQILDRVETSRRAGRQVRLF